MTVRTVALVWAAALVIGTRGFLLSAGGRRQGQRFATPPLAVPGDEVTDEALANMDNDSVIRAPLRFLGPYPTVPLKFPRLSTPSQREKDLSGISLDFVLDTAGWGDTFNHSLSLQRLTRSAFFYQLDQQM